MEISSNNLYYGNNQSFGKTILDSAKLRKRTMSGAYKQADVFVSRLTKGDAKDISLLEKIRKNWSECCAFSEVIIENFEGAPRSNFYMTELKNRNPKIKRKVCCLMQTTNPEASSARDAYHIDYIQSAPAIANKMDMSPIKGAGELTIYEAVKEAKKEGYKKVELFSCRDDFYSKLGFHKVDNFGFGNFELENKDFETFLNRVEKKYDIGK